MLRVLLPTDFSTASHNAIVYTLKLFEGKKVWYDVLHIGEEDDDETDIKEAQHIARLQFDSLKHQLTALHKVTIPEQFYFHFLPNTEVHKGIEYYAEEFNIDLIIIGSAGGSDLGNILNGSTTLALIDSTTKPVLAVPPKSKFSKLRTIVYATDLNDIDFEAKELIAFARVFEAAVHFVHVFPEVISATRFNPGHISHDLIRKFNYPHITFDAIMNNDVEKGLIQFIESHKPDMVAMFTHKRNMLELLIDKKVTQKIALTSEVPVFTFRKSIEPVKV